MTAKLNEVQVKQLLWVLQAVSHVDPHYVRSDYPELLVNDQLSVKLRLNIRGGFTPAEWQRLTDATPEAGRIVDQMLDGYYDDELLARKGLGDILDPQDLAELADWCSVFTSEVK